MKDYIKNAVRTEAPITVSVSERLRWSARLIHGIFGLTTEVGEFTDGLKRHIFYGKDIDYVNLQEEVGDLLWYLAIILDELSTQSKLDLNFEKVMQLNIAKLRERFPDKFTEEDALNRNLEKEREKLDDVNLRKEKAGVNSWSQDIEKQTERVPAHPSVSTITKVPGGGTYLILKLDEDTKMAHNARQNAIQFARDIWHHDEESRRLSEQIKQQVQAIVEELPPLKAPKDEIANKERSTSI